MTFSAVLYLALRHVDNFDEGFMLTGAMMIAEGKLPYRDFITMYGPGQYALYAGAFILFGQSMMVAKLLHALLFSGLIMTQTALALRLSGHGWRAALAVWAVLFGLAVDINVPSTIAIYTALLFAMLAMLVTVGVQEGPVSESRGLTASVLLALSGLVRWDIGIFCFAALCAATWLAETTEPPAEPRGVRVRRAFKKLLRLFMPFTVVMGGVYGWLLLVASDPVTWWNETFLFLLHEFTAWRGAAYLPVVLQGIRDIPVAERPILQFISCLLGVLVVLTPLVLIALSLAGVWQSHAQSTQRTGWPARDVAIVALAGMTTLMFNQMRGRSDFGHAMPIFMACLPLLAAHSARATGNPWRGPLQVRNMSGLVFGFAFLLLLGGLGSWASTLVVPMKAPRMSGVQGPEYLLDYVHVVEYVVANTRPEEPIYSGVIDHSRLLINDPLLYFATGRMPADRFMELEPGIANTAKGQREIVDALERKQVRVAVILDRVSREANRSGQSNGVHLLDEYLRKNYQLVMQVGRHSVVRRKANS